MNYYKRLIINRPAAFFLLLVLGLMGILIVYVGIKEIIFSLDGVKDVWGVILGCIFSIYGTLLTYWSFVSGPLTSAYSLEKNDFVVKSKGEYVHIKYKKYEVYDLKENVRNNIFKEKNGKAINHIDKKRIYNAMLYIFPEALEKALDGRKNITLSQIYIGFNNKKEMNDEEKIKYLNKRNIKKRLRIFTFLAGVIFALVTIQLIAGFIPDLSMYFKRSALETLFLFAMLIALDSIFFAISKMLLELSFKSILMYKWVMEKKVYVIGCNIWDKVCTEYTDSEYGSIFHYYLRVADENYVCKDWIEVSAKTYNKIEKENIQEVKMIILEDKDYPIHDIIVE